EAIEGTDKCIIRGAKLAKKNAAVIKVAKPSQDKRFDIPAVGLRTLKTMKKYKANLLAVEANETIIVDQEQVVEYANKHNIVIMAV
ncbi:LpxI family protein, partial [bacterium]|nr:LpxI family protein [bacterium]